MPSALPPSLNDADAWLAAAAARIEDDPDLLVALSDEEVAALLAAEGTSVSGVAAGVRRRVREESRTQTPRWRWPVAVGAVAVAGLVAVAMVQFGGPDPAETVFVYESELVAYAGPQTKGADSSAARLLLAAARDTPPDTALARRAAVAFEAQPDPDAAFFAGLAYRLADDDRAAEAAFDRVPPTSSYADDARALR